MWVKCTIFREIFEQFNPELTATTTKERPPGFNPLVARWRSIQVVGGTACDCSLDCRNNDIFSALVCAYSSWITTYFTSTVSEVGRNQFWLMVRIRCLQPYNFPWIAINTSAFKHTHTHTNVKLQLGSSEILDDSDLCSMLYKTHILCPLLGYRKHRSEKKQEVKVIWQKAASSPQRSMPLCKPTGHAHVCPIKNCPFPYVTPM